MVALNLLPKDCRPTPEKLARRVESALADAAVLHDYDDALDALDGDPAKLARSHRHRALWRAWLDEATPVHEATQGVGGIDPRRLRELHVERWAVESLLRRTPEEEAAIARRATAESAEAAARGDRGVGLDELRREVAERRRATGVPRRPTRQTTRRMGREHGFSLVEEL